jgi:3-hydroxyisobutyrate dehydrogenase
VPFNGGDLTSRRFVPIYEEERQMSDVAKGDFQVKRPRVVALLGAGGTMGFAMARNIAAAGMGVRAWNRSREKAEPLTEHGVEVVADPARAAEGASVIVTVLAELNAVVESMDGEGGALSATAPSAVWTQMGTVGESETRQLASLADRHGVGFVDAPVLGTKAPAKEGALVVLASGPPELRDAVQPIFDAVGRRTMWISETAGDATSLKLVANTWVLTVMEGAAEAIALAEGLGLDPSLLLEAVKDGPLDMQYLQSKGQAIIERDFEPSFRLRLAAKDAGLVAEAAERHRLDLPLVDLLRDRLARGAETNGDDDMSATYLTSAPRARNAGETSNP